MAVRIHRARRQLELRFGGAGVPVQHSLQLIEGFANAVIGDATLGEVVGADFFGAFAAANLTAARGIQGCVLPVLFRIVEAGAQNLHAFDLVLQLRFLVLAGNHKPGWQVGDAHGRVGGVDTLTTGAARAKDIYAQVLRTDVHFHFIHFG